MYLAILGYSMMALMIFVLLKGKLTPVVAFVILPPVFALLAGFSISQISEFVVLGVPKTINAMALTLFATVYFRIMTDRGLFEPIVRWLSKKAGGNVSAILIITTIIAAISHMDTGVTSTMLITIPAMLPLYKRFNIRVEWMFLMIAQAVGVINLLPHGGGPVRVSSVTGLEISLIFRTLAPVIIAMLVYNVISAYFYGKAEERYIQKTYGSKNNDVAGAHADLSNIREVTVDAKYWANLILTFLLLGMMFQGKISGYFIFMVGLAIAMMINFPKTTDQIKVIKASGEDALYISAIMLASGVMVGILGGTGMLASMADVVVNFIPTSLKSVYGVLIGYLSIPLSIALGADGFYYGLTSLFTQVGNSYGFSSISIVSIMMLARDAFGNLTPVSPVTYLAPGMLGKELGVFIKFSFKYLLLYFTVEVILTILFGIMPLVV